MNRKVVTLALLVVTACEEEPPKFEIPDVEVCLMNRFGGEYCIDVYEAARGDSMVDDAGVDNDAPPVSLPSRMPWTEINWQGALAACQRKGKRLCEREEWLDACDGVVGTDGTQFVYGDTIDSARCNTEGMGVEAGGTRANCKASTGTFDQNGNIWEWTGIDLANAVARGGSYRSSRTHHCTSPEIPMVGDVIDPNGGRSAEVGFRCCRDR